MLKNIGLIVCLLLTGCAHQPIEYKTENMFVFDQGFVISDTDRFALEDIEMAVTIFYIEWSKKFGDPGKKVFQNLSDITIFITKDRQVLKNVHDIDGFKYDEAEVDGVTYARNVIWIWAGDLPGTLSDTSLVHELVHASLWKLNGTGDYDHEGGMIDLWSREHTIFIHDVNQELRGRNL